MAAKPSTARREPTGAGGRGQTRTRAGHKKMSAKVRRPLAGGVRAGRGGGRSDAVPPVGGRPRTARAGARRGSTPQAHLRCLSAAAPLPLRSAGRRTLAAGLVTFQITWTGRSWRDGRVSICLVECASPEHKTFYKWGLTCSRYPKRYK